MKNDIDIKRYDRLIYKSSLSDVNQYVNEKLDKVHNELFMSALEKAFNIMKMTYMDEICEDFGLSNASDITLEEFLKEYKMKEIRDDEYFKPSKVIFKRKRFPYDKYEIDLSQTWDGFQYTTIQKSSKDKLTDLDNINGLRVVYIDYVNGRSKLIDKMTGNAYWIDNSYLDGDVELDDTFTLDNTFYKKLQNHVS